jgi:hypothetical protein
VTALSMSLSALVEQPNAVAVSAGSAGTAQDLATCGAIGGTRAGADLLFDLTEVNDSWYGGSAGSRPRTEA